jgi:2-C-methyl-D-erythritol 4-phosphate cytidylyltransferase
VKQLVLVIAAGDRELFQMKFGANVAILGVDVVTGGAERADSVRAALARVKPDVEFIAVHDAARPLLTDEWINQVFQAAANHGAAIPAIPVTDTLKRASRNNTVEETISRENLWLAQTPQVFRRQLFRSALPILLAIRRILETIKT